jgi:fatty-acyl-CoA synthase
VGQGDRAAVVGAPHPRWGEAGIASVVLVRDPRTSPGELLDWCRARPARYKIAARVVLVDERPRNATGKLLKGPLRAAAASAEQDRAHA